MDNKNIFLFSGQGSHYYQMGKGLYEADAVFRKWMRHLDKIVMDSEGFSVIDRIYDSTRRITDDFSHLKSTNPALFMVECSLAFTLIESGIEPDIVIGTSIGEFTAAVVAGVMPYEQAMNLVIQQSRCIEYHCPPGSVVAVIADPMLYDQVDVLRNKTEVAFINKETHFVIAGSLPQVEEAVQYLKANGIVHQRLAVSHGFHSYNLDAAYHSFRNILQSKSFNAPKIPYISCVTGGEVQDAKGDYFWNVIRKPMLFHEALSGILPAESDYNLIDLGPTGMLASLSKRYVQSGAKTQAFQVMTQYGNEVDHFKRLKETLVTHKSVVNVPYQKPTAYVFPGQGSQYRGMGEQLFARYPQLLSEADDILGYSISNLCKNNPENNLHKTQFTQPALYVVNALSYLSLKDEGKKSPHYVAGHSMGEYNALFAAAAIDFATGLKLVQKRGELMSQAQSGGMAAILGLSEKSILEILMLHGLSIEVANLNSPSQIVVSGVKTDILNAQSIFENSGATYIPLNVSGAFHSRLMNDVKETFSRHLQNFNFSPPEIPVISNVLARPYSAYNIQQLLSDQITHPVKWTDSVRFLMENGVEEFIETGPGDVLSKLIDSIKRHTLSEA